MLGTCCRPHRLPYHFDVGLCLIRIPKSWPKPGAGAEQMSHARPAAAAAPADAEQVGLGHFVCCALCAGLTTAHRIAPGGGHSGGRTR